MIDPGFDTSTLGVHVVLGRKLQPLTIGHLALLERFESGFAFGTTKEPTYADLIFSVFVCSLTHEKATAALRNRVRLLLRMVLWRFVCGRFDLPEAVASFVEYIQDNKKEPQYWILKDGGGEKTGVPFSQFLKTRLKEEFNVSEADALNTPYRVAVLDYLTHMETSGAIRFYTDTDREIIRMINDPEHQERLRKWAEKVSKQ